MGALVFILLFFLGLLLATIGSIIGVVDAFRVSTVWGFLSLLVPFALLVFCIKFWRERKWARNGLIMGLIGLGMTLISLPLGGGISTLLARNGTDEELEDFTVEEIPADSEVQPDSAENGEVEVPAEEEAELFEEAMLPGLPTAAEIARAELLPSTDPNERLKEIESERADPYAIVTVPPPPRPAPPAPERPPGAGTTSPQTTPTGPGNGGAQAGPNDTGPGGAGAPGELGPNAPLPELPEPTVVASQVEVSGVAAVNGENFAIVRAPGEPTSRYVKVGDRLSNGAVLVKRIETRPGGAPVVVFEERGEEIALPVGANVGTPEETTADESTETASIATLPVPNLRR